MPVFTDAKQLVDWYDNQERVLTPAFLDTINWQDVDKYTLDPSIIPIIMYFRDVEKFTEIYYNELRKTPTGRDKDIRQFMDKWQHEEDLHGELMNRFLEAAGYPSEEKWFQKLKERIPAGYKFSSNATAVIANLFGKRFSAVHMTWGAINEMTTLTGYRRLIEKANHPVLTQIIKGILREESVHSFFYASLAKMKLQKSRYNQQITRYIVEKFWSPVGEGAKKKDEVTNIMKFLFDGEEGVSIVDTYVNKHLQRFPGFSGTDVVTKRFASIVV